MFTRDGLMWRDWELEILRSYAGKETAADIARAVNRDVHGVYNKAYELGISLVRHICTRCGQPMVKGKSRYRCRPCDTAYERKRRNKNA